MVKYNEIIIRTDEDYLHHPKMLSAILEINPDSVVLSKLSDSEIVDCNKEFLKQTGYSREEVIGNKILDLNLLSREEYINYVDEIREKKTLSHFEVMVRRKDGSFIYALNSAKIIMFNDIQMVLNIAHDITGYKTVEANKQMLANLVESSEDAVITKSISGIIKSWNKGAEQIYGYLPEDVIGKHISILAPKHLKDEISELIEKVKQGKKVRHHETIRLKKDGKLINVSVTLSPISDTSGNTVGISTIARDISELKRREEKLESTMNDLKRSNKELQQFAYVSSHDLQEPIRMVTLYSQLLEKRYKDRLDDDANDFIEFIVDGAYRMKHLIDDLLVYSRVTSQIKEFEYINLETVLSTVISDLYVNIQENNAKIIHDPLPTVSADPTQIGQVFQNLITNAIKFQGNNTPEIQISVQKQRYYKEWIFAVKDNGIGIERRHQERIFEVFKRLHTREEYPGTGIGLSIVKKIIKHHGGQIWVESEPGRGSTFYFTIPKKNFNSNSV